MKLVTSTGDYKFYVPSITEADGLACASPSGFVTRIMTNLVSGKFTVDDGKLYDYLRLLYNSEKIQIEPSSCAAFAGPCGFLQFPQAIAYCKTHNLSEELLQGATHIVWATGGKMIPQEIYEEHLNTYL